jgi:hypothetical protein
MKSNNAIIMMYLWRVFVKGIDSHVNALGKAFFENLFVCLYSLCQTFSINWYLSLKIKKSVGE